jgi:hypothetical protein
VGTQSSSLTPDSYMQTQAAPAQDLTPDAYMQGQSGNQDAAQKLLNNPGNALEGFLQGLAKGAASTVYGLTDLANKVVPNPVALDPDYRRSLTEANGPGQGTGKFIEQALEYAGPDAVAGALTKGSGALLKIAAKAGVGGAVAAAQSGGDPVSTALGAGFGGIGEAGSALYQGIKGLKPEPTMQNFSRSFGNATPRQKIPITRALDTLKADGVIPGANLDEMRGVIKDRVKELGQEYQNLDPAFKAREQDPNQILSELDKLKKQYSRGGVTAKEFAPVVQKIEDHIDTAELLAAQNPNGKLTIDDLKYLRDSANEGVNWDAPKGERNIYNDLSNVDRQQMDKLVPEETSLHRKYAQYKQLESVADHNFEMGKGNTTSGLSGALQQHVANPVIGAQLGGALGHALGGTSGAVLGEIGGAVLYPKLAAPAVRALEAASQSGVLSKLNPAQNATLQNALKRRDTQAILSLLGGTVKGSGFEATTGGATR